MDRPGKPCMLTVLRTIKSYLQHPHHAWSVERREWGVLLADRQLRRLGAKDMYDRRPLQVYPPDWADLLNIYTLVRRRKPSIIVEFGSGCSTLMFARALADNHAAGVAAGHLYSVETSERFKDLTEGYIPPPLKPFVDITHSGIECGEMYGQKVMWHSTIPDVRPNLVYLDGPDYQDFSGDIRTQPEGVMLEAKGGEDYTILIDGRWATFQFTRANLKRRYKLTYNTTHCWELLEAIP